MEGSNSPLSDDEREVIQNVSQDLSAALQPSVEDETPVSLGDLKTVAKFVKVVAE